MNFNLLKGSRHPPELVSVICSSVSSPFQQPQIRVLHPPDDVSSPPSARRAINILSRNKQRPLCWVTGGGCVVMKWRTRICRAGRMKRRPQCHDGVWPRGGRGDRAAACWPACEAQLRFLYLFPWHLLYPFVSLSLECYITSRFLCLVSKVPHPSPVDAWVPLGVESLVHAALIEHLLCARGRQDSSLLTWSSGFPRGLRLDFTDSSSGHQLMARPDTLTSLVSETDCLFKACRK